MKVQRIDYNGRIENHAPSVLSDDYTLCGLDNVGDMDLNIKKMETIEGKITCSLCIDIIKFCKSIKINQLIK
jgi:hypothetical protein